MRVKHLNYILLIFVLIFINSCNALENHSNSATMLVLEGITGDDISGEAGSTTVFSDVLCGDSGIINDVGEATVSAYPLDPENTDRTHYQNVIVDQVDVEYTRTEDGRNTPGVDVPFGFSQQVHHLVEVGEALKMPFVLVQHVAKLESPLVELRTWTNQEKILKLEAKITIHAKDVAGNRLEPVTGTISVWCTNFDSDCDKEDETTT